jgi:hypothetical protein
MCARIADRDHGVQRGNLGREAVHVSQLIHRLVLNELIGRSSPKCPKRARD